MSLEPKVGILITGFNDPPKQLNRVLISAYQQDYGNLYIVLVDDGSDLPLVCDISFSFDPGRLQVTRISHGERAAAREHGMSLLREKGVDYFLFLDSDMELHEFFIRECVSFLTKNHADALIVPELAFSEQTNYWTKVKVFERNLYSRGRQVDESSIEAARFWKLSSFPGFVPGLNAFEEIQPTIHCMRNGGRVLKSDTIYISHDEKYVTMGKLLSKKNYYFEEMEKHSSAVKLTDLIKKYYFFRKQLYLRDNFLQYISHPILTGGVMVMYLLLTFSMAQSFLFRRVRRLL